MRISDWSSDVCSSDLQLVLAEAGALLQHGVDQLAGRLRAAGQRGHLLLVVEQLVEQEADVVERRGVRSEEHTSELQSLMRTSYAVFCLKKKKKKTNHPHATKTTNKSVTENIYTHEPSHHD